MTAKQHIAEMLADPFGSKMTLVVASMSPPDIRLYRILDGLSHYLGRIEDMRRYPALEVETKPTDTPRYTHFRHQYKTGVELYAILASFADNY